MKIFLTGATGFIGHSVLSKLVLDSKVEKIYCLVRNNNEHTLLSNKNVEFLKGSLEAIKKFKSELLDSTHVIHCAADASFSANRLSCEINFKSVESFCEVLQESRKLKNFVFLSSIGAVDRHKFDFCSNKLNEESKLFPKSNYGKSKKKAEEIIYRSKLPYTIMAI